MLPVSESVKLRLKLCVDSDIQVGAAPYALTTTSDIPLGLSPSLMSLELSYARGISKLAELRILSKIQTANQKPLVKICFKEAGDNLREPRPFFTWKGT